MFKMGCSMAKKILAIDGKQAPDQQGGSSSSSSSSKIKQSDKQQGEFCAASSAASGQQGGAKRGNADELGDFSKLEEDPRIPLNVRQIFKITKSWKAIARTMSKTGTAMFLNLFEQNQDLLYLFQRFQHLKGRELHESAELREHAAQVMSILDQSINSLSDYDNFVTYLHSIGKSHRKVPGFKRAHFWKIEQPFLKAVKQTLDERCNETIEGIYKIAIKLIIETIADGYGPDEDEEVGSTKQGGRSTPGPGPPPPPPPSSGTSNGSESSSSARKSGGKDSSGSDKNSSSKETSDAQKRGKNYSGGKGGKNNNSAFAGVATTTKSCCCCCSSDRRAPFIALEVSAEESAHYERLMSELDKPSQDELLLGKREDDKTRRDNNRLADCDPSNQMIVASRLGVSSSIEKEQQGKRLDYSDHYQACTPPPSYTYARQQCQSACCGASTLSSSISSIEKEEEEEKGKERVVAGERGGHKEAGGRSELETTLFVLRELLSLLVTRKQVGMVAAAPGSTPIEKKAFKLQIPETCSRSGRDLSHDETHSASSADEAAKLAALPLKGNSNSSNNNYNNNNGYSYEMTAPREVERGGSGSLINRKGQSDSSGSASAREGTRGTLGNGLQQSSQSCCTPNSGSSELPVISLVFGSKGTNAAVNSGGSLTRPASFSAQKEEEEEEEVREVEKINVGRGEGREGRRERQEVRIGNEPTVRLTKVAGAKGKTAPYFSCLPSRLDDNNNINCSLANLQTCLSSDQDIYRCTRGSSSLDGLSDSCEASNEQEDESVYCRQLRLFSNIQRKDDERMRRKLEADVLIDRKRNEAAYDEALIQANQIQACSQMVEFPPHSTIHLVASTSSRPTRAYLGSFNEASTQSSLFRANELNFLPPAVQQQQPQHQSRRQQSAKVNGESAEPEASNSMELSSGSPMSWQAVERSQLAFCESPSSSQELLTSTENGRNLAEASDCQLKGDSSSSSQATLSIDNRSSLNLNNLQYTQSFANPTNKNNENLLNSSCIREPAQQQKELGEIDDRINNQERKDNNQVESHHYSASSGNIYRKGNNSSPEKHERCSTKQFQLTTNPADLRELIKMLMLTSAATSTSSTFNKIAAEQNYHLPAKAQNNNNNFSRCSRGNLMGLNNIPTSPPTTITSLAS